MARHEINAYFCDDAYVSGAMSRMRIVIDASKAFGSGMGTHIRYVMPSVIEHMTDAEFGALVEPGGAHRHAYRPAERVQFVAMMDSPGGIQEQLKSPRVIRRADVIWATRLAYLLFSRMGMISTVHDVAHLYTRPGGSSGPTAFHLLLVGRRLLRPANRRVIGRIVDGNCQAGDCTTPVAKSPVVWNGTSIQIGPNRHAHRSSSPK